MTKYQFDEEYIDAGSALKEFFLFAQEKGELALTDFSYEGYNGIADHATGLGGWNGQGASDFRNALAEALNRLR